MPIPDLFKDTFATIEEEPYLLISDMDISNALDRCIPEGKSDYLVEELAEILSFRFVENYTTDSNAWNTYYGPGGSRTAMDGTISEFPTLDMITPPSNW